MKKVIFEKDYYGENINDVFEEINHSINAQDLPTDEHGFFKGTISIQVTYSNYEGE
jgi:hypothetical protein